MCKTKNGIEYSKRTVYVVPLDDYVFRDDEDRIQHIHVNLYISTVIGGYNGEEWWDIWCGCDNCAYCQFLAQVNKRNNLLDDAIIYGKENYFKYKEFQNYIEHNKGA